MILSFSNFDDLLKVIVVLFSVRADGNPEIQIGDDFPYDQAQFEVEELIGNSHIQWVVIESNGNQIIGQLKNL
jgi:hypothetical protein